MSKDLSIEQAVAPHVDPAWAEALLLELRLRGVAGEVIGDVLAEVDAHVVDSGQGAAEAFGDPVAYADALDLPRSPAQSRGGIAATVAPVAVQVLGMSITLAASHALADGGRLVITAGALVSAVVVAVLIGVLVVAAEATMRLLLRRSWIVGVGVLWAAILVAVLPSVLPPLTALALPAVPALPALVVGLVLLAGGSVLAVRGALADDGDPVASPVPGATEPVPPSRVRRALPHLVVPIATPALVLLVLVVTWAASASS